MKLFIPEIGTEMELTQAATVTIYNESRNRSFLEAVLGFATDHEFNWFRKFNNPKPNDKTIQVQNPERPDAKYWEADATWLVKLPKGSKLKVDRIYIRKGAQEYSSLTFWFQLTEGKPLGLLVGKKKQKKYRFWVKLNECNFNVKINPAG